MLKKTLLSKASIAATTLLIVFGCSKAPAPTGSSAGGASALVNKAAGKYAVSYSAAEPTSDVRQSSGEAQSDAPPVGRIVGVVKWNGPVPEPERIQVAKDAHVCAEHGAHDRLSELLIVNPSGGGVKDSIVSLFGKIENAKPLEELQHPDTLNQRACSYDPRVFVVPVGARLTLTSEDEVGHNVRMNGAADLNIAISKGGRASRRMEQAGLVKIGCDIHPWMSGYIHVVKHPYYAVTDGDGQFELTDVPAGTHQIRLWHEAWWTEDGSVAAPIVSTHSVTVRDGATTTATFEFSEPALTQTAGGKSAKATSKR